MARTLTKHEIFELSVEERLRLIETVFAPDPLDRITAASLPQPHASSTA
jgi:hypothetical protein